MGWGTGFRPTELVWPTCFWPVDSGVASQLTLSRQIYLKAGLPFQKMEGNNIFPVFG